MPLTTVIITIVAAGRSVVACEQVHPHAGTDQIDPERPGCHCSGLVDRESLRAVSTPQSIPRRALTRSRHRSPHGFARQPKSTKQYGSPLTAGDIVKHTLLFVIGSALSLSAFAQAGPQESIALVPVGSMPTYVCERDQPHGRSSRLSASRRSLGRGSGRNRFAAFSRRKSQSAQQARHHGSRSGLWEPAKPHDLWHRISDLRDVGDLA